jgi:Mg2+ and Co2+ transporter CorA
MQVRFLSASAVEDHSVDELPSLLARDDGFVWVDVERFDDSHERTLAEVFGFHEMALRACRDRNHLPATHAYPDHVFVVLHAPEPGESGHVHLLELDQFVGRRFLVTVHGPLNPEVPVDRALEETRAVLARVRGGRLRPGSPMELSYAVVTAIARRQRHAVTDVAEKVAALEQRVMAGSFGNPEDFLEEMFLVRHELLTVRTMAAQSHEVYARLASLGRFVAEEDRPLLEDLADQFERVRSITDGEKEFLFGVIDLYQTRITTKMTVAMERLAVLAAVTLPVTAVASVYGMNVIVNDRTHTVQLALVLILMVTISGVLLRWTKRQGWW